MQIKRAIMPYVFGGLMLLLSGCGSRKNNDVIKSIDKFTTIHVEKSDNVTDNYITINRLLRIGQYEAAQDSLENYLENEMIEAAELRGGISGVGFAPITEDYLTRVLRKQVNKIRNHLREN